MKINCSWIFDRKKIGKLIGKFWGIYIFLVLEELDFLFKFFGFFEELFWQARCTCILPTQRRLWDLFFSLFNIFLLSFQTSWCLSGFCPHLGRKISGSFVETALHVSRGSCLCGNYSFWRKIRNFIKVLGSSVFKYRSNGLKKVFLTSCRKNFLTLQSKILMSFFYLKPF